MADGLPPPLDSGYQLWYYYPSVAGNIIFLVLFAMLSIMHLVGLWLNRMMFCLPLLIGGILEVAGYGVRAYAHDNTGEVGVYAGQATLILLAPILFAASIYMYLGRLMIATDTTALSPIPVKWLTKTFVFGDILCFIIQAGGSAVMSIDSIKNGTKIGEDIILAGLILQIFFTGFFLVVVAIVHKRMARERKLVDTAIAWRRLLWTLYIIGGLITGRNIFRAIEYGLGQDGYLMVNEWAGWVFDGVLMVIAVAVGVSWYIGRGSKLSRYEGYTSSTDSMTRIKTERESSV